MKRTIVKPVADPLDDIDRVAPVDSLMARQDRADLPGNRSDEPGNGGRSAAPFAGEESGADEDDDAAMSEDVDDVEAPSALDPDIAVGIENAGDGPPGIGPDDDEPIEETERLGGDSSTV